MLKAMLDAVSSAKKDPLAWSPIGSGVEPE
jgi:hypothetical protein